MHSSFVSHPETEIQKVLRELAEGQYVCVCLSYEFEQYYLPDAPRIKLLAIAELANGQICRYSVSEYSEDASRKLEHASAAYQTSQDFGVVEVVLSELGWPVLDAREPLSLEAVCIEKPWGQEVWFTGIESRGQSRVSDGRFSAPLPWVLSFLPDFLAAKQQQSLNLLKILDPLPEEVFGDLYFELHEEKQEVYVVTHVDKSAWSSGIGKIKIGFDQSVRDRFQDDESFVDAYRAAVGQYEAVRREIDLVLDGCRRGEGVALDAPVSAATTKAWLKTVDEQLIAKEEALRQEMDSFKGEIDLKVGDVLKVPCFTPHSLMHGVRTIEFQTPVYERRILSFAQKVLTQSEWDTDTAIDCMSLESHELQPLVHVQSAQDVEVEEVVDFSDFKVWRLTFKSGAKFEIPKGRYYALVMGVSGQVQVNGKSFAAECAGMISAASDSLQFLAGESSVALIAFPKQKA